MVTSLDNYFKSIGIYAKLNIVSDGICKCNQKDYLDFDEYIKYLFQNENLKGTSNPSSCDTIIFQKTHNHIILIEFKDMSLINQNNLSTFSSEKTVDFNYKISDTLLIIGRYTLMNIFEIKKSFFYVYKNDDKNMKRKINNHFKNKFNKYSYLFENVQTMDKDNFLYFLRNNSL